MGKVTKALVERFFNDQCTYEEAEEVLAWLSTRRGEQYLQQRIEAGLSAADKVHAPEGDPRSARMWQNIQRKRLETDLRKRHGRGRTQFPGFLRVAAIIAVFLLAGILYVGLNPSRSGHSIAMLSYRTTQNQHKKLTLSDGSTIILNGDSQLLIPGAFSQQTRKVILKGEAYFEIKHNADKPFVIQAGDAVIKDLGTAFNVNVDSAGGDVQVAVFSGEVSLRGRKDPESKATFLTKNHYGRLSSRTGVTRVEETDVRNYRSWMIGRMVFDKTSLPEIDLQLHRIYHMNSTISDPELRNLKLTADFKSGPVGEVLEIIATSLNIHYRLDGSHIIWTK